MHAVEAMYGLPYVLTASGNLFLNMSDAGNLQFHMHYSYFRKDFQMLLAHKGEI